MTTWIDVNKKKPFPFDLVRIKDVNGKIQTGWWTGSSWDYGNHKIYKEKEWAKGPFNCIT